MAVVGELAVPTHVHRLGPDEREHIYREAISGVDAVSGRESGDEEKKVILESGNEKAVKPVDKKTAISVVNESASRAGRHAT
ncbi:hypothetical protein ACMFMF_010217 [Clarireedia jacksonii]